jgi:hypothetical protein
MNWHLPAEERTHLRELARKQAEYAALPVMQQRRQMWFDLNDAKPGARPPVIIETRTFDRDFLPASVFRCQSETGRNLEHQLLRNLRRHEFINDDFVMSDTFDIGWQTHIDPYGVELKRETVADAQGVPTGYHFDHPIQDLERDFTLLKPVTFAVDRDGTRAWQAFVEDVLGDVLPVALRTGSFGRNSLTQAVVHLMGMEAFFLAMYEQPDAVHRLMAYLRDNSLALMRWAEQENLLRLNHRNQESFGSSLTFTNRLPAPGFDPGQVRLCDQWGCADSQETVGVSPAMFHEFCFPYFRAVAEPLGLLYYGCCEPAHPFWNDIRQLPHLKKVSISRWCDQKFMGDALRGTEIVFSRKPDPNFLSVDETLREDAWAAHIRETLDATRGVFVEFIIRDVYTVQATSTTRAVPSQLPGVRLTGIIVRRCLRFLPGKP